VPEFTWHQRYLSVISASGCETIVMNQTALKNSDQNVSQYIQTIAVCVLVFDNETLEHHASPEAAAEALANGTCFWPSAGDPSQLGIPEDVSDWTLVP